MSQHASKSPAMLMRVIEYVLVCYMRVIEDTTVCPTMLMRIPQYMYVLVC